MFSSSSQTDDKPIDTKDVENYFSAGTANNSQKFIPFENRVTAKQTFTNENPRQEFIKPTFNSLNNDRPCVFSSEYKNKNQSNKIPKNSYPNELSKEVKLSFSEHAKSSSHKSKQLLDLQNKFKKIEKNIFKKLNKLDSASQSLSRQNRTSEMLDGLEYLNIVRKKETNNNSKISKSFEGRKLNFANKRLSKLENFSESYSELVPSRREPKQKVWPKHDGRKAEIISENKSFRQNMDIILGRKKIASKYEKKNKNFNSRENKKLMQSTFSRLNTSKLKSVSKNGFDRGNASVIASTILPNNVIANLLKLNKFKKSSGNILSFVPTAISGKKTSTFFANLPKKTCFQTNKFNNEKNVLNVFAANKNKLRNTQKFSVKVMKPIANILIQKPYLELNNVKNKPCHVQKTIEPFKFEGIVRKSQNLNVFSKVNQILDKTKHDKNHFRHSINLKTKDKVNVLSGLHNIYESKNQTNSGSKADFPGHPMITKKSGCLEKPLPMKDNKNAFTKIFRLPKTELILKSKRKNLNRISYDESALKNRQSLQKEKTMIVLTPSSNQNSESVHRFIKKEITNKAHLPVRVRKPSSNLVLNPESLILYESNNQVGMRKKNEDSSLKDVKNKKKLLTPRYYDSIKKRINIGFGSSQQPE